MADKLILQEKLYKRAGFWNKFPHYGIPHLNSLPPRAGLEPAPTKVIKEIRPGIYQY